MHSNKKSSQKPVIKELVSEYRLRVDGLIRLDESKSDDELFPFKTTEGVVIEVAYDDNAKPLVIESFESRNGFAIADELYQKALDSAMDIKKVKNACTVVLMALAHNQTAAVAADSQGAHDFAFHYLLKVAELFGMYVATSNLPESHIYWHEKMDSRLKKGFREKAGQKKKPEKDMVKAKYFELYDRDGKEPSARRVADAIRPKCKEIACSEQMVGRWIREEWRSEYATTQLEK